jgi:hypothetical protein
VARSIYLSAAAFLQAQQRPWFNAGSFFFEGLFWLPWTKGLRPTWPTDPRIFRKVSIDILKWVCLKMGYHRCRYTRYTDTTIESFKIIFQMGI